MTIRKLLLISNKANENLKKYKQVYRKINDFKINDDDAVSLILEELEFEGAENEQKTIKEG